MCVCVCVCDLVHALCIYQVSSPPSRLQQDPYSSDQGETTILYTTSVVCSFLSQQHIQPHESNVNRVLYVVYIYCCFGVR